MKEQKKHMNTKTIKETLAPIILFPNNSSPDLK